MSGLAPWLMGLTMLAAFALAAGGMAVWVKYKERKRGALMIVAALVLIANVAIWAV